MTGALRDFALRFHDQAEPAPLPGLDRPPPRAWRVTLADASRDNRLEDIARTFDPAAPDMLRTQLIEALGDLGIWPIEISNGQDEGKAIVVA